MQDDIPDLSQYTESAEYYSDAYAQALARQDYAGLVHAQWGLIARGSEAVPYALTLLNHDDYEARAAGASILGWVGETGTHRDDIIKALIEASYHELQRPAPEDGHEREALDTMIQALSQLGGTNVVSTLGRLIIDPGSDSDRIWAIVESLDNVIDSSVFALDEDRGRFLTHFEGRKREVMSNKERI